VGGGLDRVGIGLGARPEVVGEAAEGNPAEPVACEQLGCAVNVVLVSHRGSRERNDIRDRRRRTDGMTPTLADTTLPRYFIL
jgi:hypothetical protein